MVTEMIHSSKVEFDAFDIPETCYNRNLTDLWEVLPEEEEQESARASIYCFVGSHTQ